VRWLIALGLLIGSLALFHLGTLNTLVDYKTLAIARVYQGVGLAFLFIPINNAAYANVSTLSSSNAAAVINLSRNLGSSVGISFVVTLLARSAQGHQTVLASHATPFDADFQARLQGLTERFMSQGVDAAHAAEQAKAAIYGQMLQQSNLLAFIDNFHILGAIFLVLIPVVFLMKRPPPGSGPMEMH
jgi:DHA2 family multidrug resistance protein